MMAIWRFVVALEMVGIPFYPKLQRKFSTDYVDSGWTWVYQNEGRLAHQLCGEHWCQAVPGVPRQARFCEDYVAALIK